MIDVLQKLEDELNDFDSIFEDTFDNDELSISIENSVLSECLKNTGDHPTEVGTDLPAYLLDHALC